MARGRCCRSFGDSILVKLWNILLGAIIAVVGGVLLIHDFIANDPVHSFSERPHRLIMVIAIALGGGLVALGFYRLPPQLRERLNVCALGAEAIVLSLLVGYGTYQLVRWPAASSTSEMLGPMLLCGSIAVLLWFQFCRKLRKWLL